LDCEALNIFRFRHLGQHFVKPGALEEISVSRMLHCLKCKAAKSTNKSDAKKIKVWSKCTGQVTIVPVLLVFYSIPFKHLQRVHKLLIRESQSQS